MKRAAPNGTAQVFTVLAKILLDLAFFIFNVLALDRVIFANSHLFGHGAGILLGHIEVPGARRRVQTDLDRRRLRHSRLSCIGEAWLPREILGARLLLAYRAESTAKQQDLEEFARMAYKPDSVPGLPPWMTIPLPPPLPTGSSCQPGPLG